MQPRPRDTIRINDLLLTVPLLTGAIWPKPPGQAVLQPVLISLSIPHNIISTASSDELSHTINYSSLCSLLRDSLGDKTPPLESLENLSARIFDLLLLRSDSDASILTEARLRVVQPRASLNCKAVGVESTATTSSGSSWSTGCVKHFCEDFECSTIIGVNACEREERQTVRVNIYIERWDSGLQRENWVDFRFMTRELHEKIGNTSFQTLEALTSYIAEATLRQLFTGQIQPPPLVTIRAAKPSAIVFATSSEIEIQRTYADYPGSFVEGGPGHQHLIPGTATHTVALALGSNLGDRFCNIELALRLLENPQAILGTKDATIFVVDTSFMYESAPMYVTDQPSFINCACMIETNLAPIALLKVLKLIESTVGRIPSIRNGPRAVDLDIVLFGDAVIDTRANPRKELDDLEGELVIPHPRLSEREFVLRPLTDMIPDFVHPLLHQKVSTLLAALDVPAGTTSMRKIITFPRCPVPTDYTFSHPVAVVPPTLTYWELPSFHPTQKRASNKTRLMATLNTTPDSFSDGATHNTLPTALKYAQNAVNVGASILDVGGYSTRPGAAFISSEEEIARVGPYIAAIRAGNAQLPISIDTFRPEVARAAILAGANCINDVYSFTGQESYPFPQTGSAADKCMSDMKSIAREYAVPVILMHSRGDAGVNKNYNMYQYAGAGQEVVEAVRIELGAKVDLIVKGRGGVRRWSVVVDPGVGFSKTLDGNLQVLRDASAITADCRVGSGLDRRRNALAGYPQLIGTSRKSFLGMILEQGVGRKTEPKERGWATAAAVACAVQQGAALVRVHDACEMADVVQVANALW